MGIVSACAMLAAVILCIFSYFTRSYFTLVVAAVLMLFQNMLGICLAGSGLGYLTQIALLLKETVVYGSVVAAVLLEGRRIFKDLGASGRYFFIYVCLLAGYMCIGQADLMAKLTSFRTLFTPVVLVLFGSVLWLRDGDEAKFLKLLLISGVFSVAFGVLESYVFSADFWTNLGMAEFNSIKGFDRWVNSDGLANSFFSYDFYDYIGSSIRRMASFIAEPIAFGHISALCYAILLFDRKRRLIPNTYTRSVLYGLFLFGAVASLSKGAIIVCVIITVLRFFDFKYPTTYMFIAVMSLVLMEMLLSSSVTSLQNHSEGLLGSFQGHFIFGEGIGTGGNYAGLYGQSEVEGAESFIGALIVQIGLPGAICLASAFILLYKSVLNSFGGFKTFKENCVMAAPVVFSLCCLIESVMSESAVGFIASGFGFICLGIVANRQVDHCPSTAMACKS